MIGALAAIASLPVLVLLVRLPFPVAVVGAVGVMAAVVLTGPRTGPENAPTEDPPLRAALDEAAPAFARLDRFAHDAGAPGPRAHAAGIAASGREIAAALRDAPGRLSDIHRVFTYYLPRAAALAEAHALLEDRMPPDAERLAAIAGLLARIDAALKTVAADCVEDALQPLDVELRLVDEALDEEFPHRKA